MKKLIIIPAFNEEDNILKVINCIKKYNSNYSDNYDIIVINDGSTDGTEEILVNNNIPHISLIHNLGIGGAVQTGYKYAFYNNYDIEIQFDGDGQHDIKYITSLVNPIIDNDIDMVIGSRFIDSDSSEFKSSKARRIGIKVISFFIKAVTGVKIYDTTSGFRAVNRRTIKLFASHYPVEYPEPVTTTILLNKKYKISEVPVNMKERSSGKSSIHTWKSVYYMVNVILSILIIGSRRDT